MKRLIVDLSSLCWTSLLIGKDDEFSFKVDFEGKEVTVNGWQYGYENAVEWLLAAWQRNHISPKDTIVVLESGNSKGMRKRWLPSYKESRDNRPPEAYEQFNQLKQKLIDAVRSIGGSSVTRPNIEADDVIAYLCAHLKGQKVIMSNDGDLAYLINKETVLWKQGNVVDTNPYGPFDTKYLPVYKALVGDSSDKIPGAKGFGPKAWLELLATFGNDGAELMEQLIVEKRIPELVEDVPVMKSLQKIIDNEQAVYASYAAGRLYPELVETLRVPITWQPGYVRPRTEIEDERLRPYGGQTKVVCAENWEQSMRFFRSKLAESDWVSLDLETTSSEEADDWLAANGSVVDPLDAKIVSMGVTFGANQNYNYYFTVGHQPTEQHTNLPMSAIRAVLEAIPKGVHRVVHNAAGFELPVWHLNLGRVNGEYFVPDVVDTALASSYVNENIPAGLKSLTKHYFDVDQLDYATVTQGRKMDQMTAAETLEYGAGDTLFTSALWNHFQVIMALEHTLQPFFDIELDCQYPIAHAFVNGINFSMERMLEIEAEDLNEEVIQQKILDNFLISRGWDGTVCPQFTEADLEVPAQLKRIYQLTLGEELKTMVRTPAKIIALIEAAEAEDAPLLASFLADKNVAQINDWVKSHFDGRPQFDTASPKQMKMFLYEVCGFPVRLVNPLTENERQNKKELADAVWAFSKLQKGSRKAVPLTPEQSKLLIEKATTDDDAIKFALKYDADEELTPILKAIQKLKEIGTRKSLFYVPYRKLLYWRDRKMHPSVRQSSTTSRRFTASKPNVTQLSKEGEGVKLRSCYIPHKKRAIVVSLDFNAQELRAQADLSDDAEFLACYIGENKKDLHSITGAEIAKLSYDDFLAKMESDDEAEAKSYKDIRNKKGKPVNFLSSYGGTAQALHRKMTILYAEAEAFLQAKKRAFPGYERYQEDVQAYVKKHGYVTCPAGTRRHLREKVLDEASWVVEAAARSAGNFGIQGGCAAQTKKAIGALWRSGVLERLDMAFYMPVHDELVFSVTIEDAVEAIRVVHQCMTQPFLPRVPAVSSISIGLNYADQIELGEEFNEEKILATIEKLYAEEIVIG